MAGETRDIKIKVTVDSDTKGSKEAAAELEKVDKAAEGAGKSMGGMAEQSRKLDTELAKSKARVKELRMEFAQTTDVSVFGDLRKEESNLRRLERVAKGIAADLAEAGGGSGIFGKIMEGASGGSGPFKIALVGGLAALAATAAPAIGAMVAGAVAGTVAGGGVIGGIIASTADERVKNAFRGLGGEFTAEAFAGGRFIRQTLDGVAEVKQAVRDVDLESMFSQAAPAVDELADGISGFIRNLSPGLTHAFAESERYSDVFGKGLAGTGAALSDFLDSILNSPGTIEGLAHGLQLLNALIIGTGNVLEVLGDTFHGTVIAGAKFSGFMEDVVGKVPILGASFRWMNDLFEETGAAGEEASDGGGAFGETLRRLIEPTVDETQRLKDLNEQLAAFNMAGLAADAAADSIVAAYMRLAESVAANGTSLDQWDEAGNRNRTMIRGLLEDLERQRQANIKAGMSTQDANAIYADQANVLQNRLTVELGFAADAVAGLIGQYKNIPTVVTTEFRQVYTESTGGYGGGEHSGVGDVRGRKAAGGGVSAGVSYLVGDGGKAEVFTPTTNGYISPSMGQWGANMGGGPGVGVMWARPFNYTGSNRLMQVFMEELRTEIAAMGGTLAVLGLRA